MAYSPEHKKEIQDRFCRMIAAGLSIRKACENEGMPNSDTLYEWLYDDAEFSEQYARARERRADARAERIDEISEKALTGEYKADAARVAIDAEKWQAGKENSKRYGDKLQVEADLNHRLPDDAVESRLAHLAGKAGIAFLAGRGGAQERQAEAGDALPGFRPSAA